MRQIRGAVARLRSEDGKGAVAPHTQNGPGQVAPQPSSSAAGELTVPPWKTKKKFAQAFESIGIQTKSDLRVDDQGGTSPTVLMSSPWAAAGPWAKPDQRPTV